VLCIVCVPLAESLSRCRRDSNRGSNFSSVWGVLWCNDLTWWTAGSHEANLRCYTILTVCYVLLLPPSDTNSTYSLPL